MRLAAKKTTVEIAKAIENLRTLLTKEYETDFAFSIHGKGHLIAASNLYDGEVVANSEEDIPK